MYLCVSVLVLVRHLRDQSGGAPLNKFVQREDVGVKFGRGVLGVVEIVEAV